MTSIALIKASDGTANASLMTIQNIRASGATSLVVNTVAGVPAKFYASMGTPHTFSDPITGEQVTVISDATAVDFAGHVDTGNLIIDAIAPGYVDTRGSAVGDIVIIRPITEWANNIANILAVSLNDDGSLKAVTQSPGWTALTNTPNTVVANGNRSYNLVFNGVDLTPAISPGMRLRTTRTVAAPTQCTSLNGTNQYFSKTSPAGMTFTDDFVVSAWVKLTKYGSSSTIASRTNNTNGWNFYITGSGQVAIVGNNGSPSNARFWSSSQSIPLNKLVHVVAQLDMSAITSNGVGASTTTNYCMIDGVDVPISTVVNGTSPSSLVQAGNLEIGSSAGGGSLFPGEIAQVAIYNSKVTQATILASMHQGLLGTETSLISAYSFNNTLNDLNANANNLTANNGAVATTADSPFGGQGNGTISSTLDYGILQSATFAGGNTTAVVQVAEGCTIPTTGGVSAVAYSSVKVPYQFPARDDKWTIFYCQGAGGSSGVTGTTWQNPNNIVLTVPVGGWAVGGMLELQITGVDGYAAISTTTSAPSDAELSTRDYLNSNIARLHGLVFLPKPVYQTAQTPWYAIMNPNGSTGAGFRGRTDDPLSYTTLSAKNTFL